DVIVIGQEKLKGFFAAAGSILGLASVQPEERSARYSELGQEMRSTIQYWQAMQVTVAATPQQRMQSVGELMEAMQVHCAVYPSALRVVVPAGYRSASKRCGLTSPPRSRKGHEAICAESLSGVLHDVARCLSTRRSR